MSEQAETSPGGRRRTAAAMFSALSHRNYRLLWVGALLSSAGTWMQAVAQGWLVLQLTDSPFWLGADGFMATLPGLLFTLFGGVLADLVDRRRLLIGSQVAAGITAFALGLLVATGIVSGARDVWVVLGLSFVTGCCMAFSLPAYQTIIVDLVGREDLANAIALNSMQFQLSRVAGPLLAGLAMQSLGVAGCFFANALSYVAIVWALALVRLGPGRAAAATETAAGREGGATARSLRDRRAIWRDLTEGFRYAGGRPRVRLVLICSAVVGLFGSPYLVLMPYVARDVLHWGEAGLSLLMGAAGAGALCGALLLAFLGDFRRKGIFILVSALAASASLVVFSLMTRPGPAVALLFAVGFSMVCFFAVSNTLLQQLVRDEMRGRVMSMWILTFIGTMPVGSFLAGAVAERLGASWALGGGGVIIAAFVALFGLPSRMFRET
jgi:MFS family permease